MSAMAPRCLPWQQANWERLGRALEKDSLPHALLFSGAESCGKVHFARALAALLLCDSPAAGVACGDCRSCELLQAGSHPDYREITPIEDSRVIRIDQVRELIEFANKTPSRGERKLILLHPAEVMNINAANALLKCLEEPAAGTHLLLVSHRPSVLSATIRSRCQSQLMATPPPELALDWLADFCSDREEAALLYEAGSQRVMTAVALRDSEELAQHQALRAGLEALQAGTLSPLQFPAMLPDLELTEVLGAMTHFLEARIRGECARGEHVSPESFELLDELGRLRRSVLQGANPNRQLTLEDLALRLGQVL